MRHNQIMVRVTAPELNAINMWAGRAGHPRATQTYELIRLGLQLNAVRAELVAAELAHPDSGPPRAGGSIGPTREWVDQLYISAGVLPR
jgi:hypothetical protein